MNSSLSGDAASTCDQRKIGPGVFEWTIEKMPLHCAAVSDGTGFSACT
jgi:hypothetical protein